MKYAFNTWTYGSFPVWLPSYPLEEVIRRLSAIGYDGIEIGCAAPHAWPRYLSAERRRILRDTLQKHNLPAVSLLPAPGGGPGINPASPIVEERVFTVDHYKEVIDLAADLGAKIVLYIAGWQIFGATRLDCWKWSADCLRNIAEHAADRGITIAIEPTSADSNLLDTADHVLEMMRLRAMRPKPHTTWHLDEMFVSIGGKRMYLWRAVDGEGEVLDCLVQSRRNKRAALRLMRKLIRKYRMVPSTFVTDRLPSYAAARAELPVTVAHERGLRQNNRAESSHVPVRRRERKMQRFRSAGSAQRFLSSHASVYNTFNICRHLITSATKRRFRTEAFEAWRAAAGIAA